MTAVLKGLDAPGKPETLDFDAGNHRLLTCAGLEKAKGVKWGWLKENKLFLPTVSKVSCSAHER